MAKRVLKYKPRYEKERARIENIIDELEKVGVIVPETVLPKIPKRIREASIRRLQKIDLNAILKKSVGVDIETGEKIPAEEAIKKYRPFPDASDVVISNFRANVISRFPESAGPVLDQWLSSLLFTQDKEDVAEMLQEAANNGVVIDYKIAYKNDLLLARIAEFMDYMPNMSKGAKEALLEFLEYDVDINSEML